MQAQGPSRRSRLAWALFYTYICIDKDLLVKTQRNEELAKQNARLTTEAVLKSASTGKQNSCQSRAYASWALAEKAPTNHVHWRPRFMNRSICAGTNVAVKRNTALREKYERGLCGQETAFKDFNVMNQQGSITRLTDLRVRALMSQYLVFSASWADWPLGRGCASEVRHSHELPLRVLRC